MVLSRGRSEQTHDMSEFLRQLEHELTRELALLKRLPTATLSPEAQQRLDACVRREALRLRSRWWRFRPELAGLAAAVALAVLWGAALHRLSERSGAAAPIVAAPDPAEALSDWIDAFKRSDERVQTLLVSDWLDESDDDPDGAVDEIFEALRGLEGIGA